MQSAAPSNIEMLLPFVLIFVIFYFLIIRPQGQKLKQQEKFVAALKRGDEVVTNSGILGTIEGLTEQIATLEVAAGVRIKILRKQIAGTQAEMFANRSKSDSKKDSKTDALVAASSKKN